MTTTKPNIILDKHTFGSSKAAETLVDILNEHSNARLNAKVSSFLTNHNYMLNQLSYIKDVSVRLAFINMVGLKIKNESIRNWPPRVVTYAKNVAQSSVKRYREMDEDIVQAEIVRVAKLRAARNKVLG
ncbi:hypothetical protein Xoosp13_355 [Xanthomonas phage Xoo-sp13]|nr:hypothetical protein Xoosp13_355 [Xanthomonas phage Xoo-sp13]